MWDMFYFETTPVFFDTIDKKNPIFGHVVSNWQGVLALGSTWHFISFLWSFKLCFVYVSMSFGTQFHFVIPWPELFMKTYNQ